MNNLNQEDFKIVMSFLEIVKNDAMKHHNNETRGFGRFVNYISLLLDGRLMSIEGQDVMSCVLIEGDGDIIAETRTRFDETITLTMEVSHMYEMLTSKWEVFDEIKIGEYIL